MNRKKRRAFFMAAALCAFGMCESAAAYQREIQEAAEAIGEKLRTSSVTTIAVVDFTDLSGNATEPGRFLAEQLSTALVNVEGLTVIDRTHLQSIIEENELASSGMIAPATARKLGQITGVQALVTGTLTQLNNSVRINAKVLDTATARIYAAVPIDIPRTQEVEDILNASTGPPNETGLASRQAETPKSPTENQQVRVAEGFTFQLQECGLSGSEIACRWLVKNESPEDRIFLLSSACQTELFDNSGNAYQVSRWEIGVLDSGGGSLAATLVPRLATPVLIRFKRASKGPFRETADRVKRITAVKVGFDSQRRGFSFGSCTYVVFEDVSLETGM